MLGWHFIIYDRSPEELDRDPPGIDSAHVLAQWLAAAGGLNWITELVQSGKATQTDFHGYPMRYQTRFADLQSVLRNGPPTDPKRWDGIHGLQQFEDRIARCSGAQIVTVTAWDRD